MTIHKKLKSRGLCTEGDEADEVYVIPFVA